jgi:hypothetical protein
MEENEKKNIGATDASLIPLDNDQPWNAADVIKKLVWATNYLLKNKNYDGPNYEELNVCVKRGEELVAFLENKAREEFYMAETKAEGDNCPPRRYWNYRLLAHENPAPGTGYTLMLHEVHYEGCKPVMYAQTGAVLLTEIDDEESTPIQSLTEVLKWMRAATKKPVLWAGPKFPQVFEHETLLTKP